MDLIRDPRCLTVIHAMSMSVGKTLCGASAGITLGWEIEEIRRGRPALVTCLWCAARRDYPRGRPRIL